MVAMLCKGKGRRVHGTIVAYWSEYHNKRRYKIRVAKMGCIITKSKRHVKACHSTRLHAERDINKNKLQTTDKFNALVDHFAELYKHEQSR